MKGAILGALAILSRAAAVTDTEGMTFMSDAGRELHAMKMQQWAETQEFNAAVRSSFPSTANQATTCNDATESLFINGERFPCKNIDFEGYVSLNDMKISSRTNAGSDIWGWLDDSGREITIMCVNNGVWFIDGTNPSTPLILGSLPALSDRGSSWCDVKVYRDVAYIIKDAASPDNGIQVFDLHRLDSISGVTPGNSAPVFDEDFLYTSHGDSHNVLIDNDTGFLYSVGSNTCRGGLHIANLANPMRPVFEACVSSDGYTHDAQCVVYDGPDSKYFGKEICFAFNEDTFTVWDVTDKQRPIMVARQRYNGVAYSHQGWTTPDYKYVLLDDELDESRARDKRTRTMIVNIESLENPIFEGRIVHGDNSIDHNLYFWGQIHAKGWGGNAPMANPPLGQYAYLSNYAAGIQVVDMSEIGNGVVKRAGYFDCAPEYNVAQFHGTWSNYMHPSGILAVSSIERGLFLIRPRMAFEEINGERMLTEPMSVNRDEEPVAEPNQPIDRDDDDDDDDDEMEGLVGAVTALALVVAAALVVVPLSALYVVRNMKKQQQNQAQAGHYLKTTL